MKDKTKPCILLVSNFLSSSGGSRAIAEELADHLINAGYTIVTTSRIRSRFPRLVDMLWTVFSQKKRYQTAYIEVYSDAAFLWAELVCKLLDILRKPYLLALHGGNLPVFAHRWPKRVKQLFKGAKRVISPSRYLQEEMHPYRKDIELIPNPLDIEKYPFRLRSKPRPYLVWLRAFHNIYNPQMAPQMIASLRTSFPNLVLTMIGPDKGDGSLQETRAEIERLGLQKNIEIVLGIPKSQVPESLSQFDIFINTTNIDNTPVSVLEAMACGLCVVSTNVGGIPYLLEDEKDSILVPPNDIEAMASAVRRILNEPGLAKKISQNAVKRSKSFDWVSVLQQWDELFATITKKDISKNA